MEADHRLFYTGKTEGIKCIGLIGEKHEKEVKVMAQDLTKGNPFSVILKFSLPVIGGNLFQLFYTPGRYSDRRQDAGSRRFGSSWFYGDCYLSGTLFYLGYYRRFWYLSGTQVWRKR